MRKLFATEDWWAVWLGVFLVALAMPVTAGFDSLGWVVKTNVWLTPSAALSPASTAYVNVPGIVSVALTYLFLLILVSVGAYAQGFSLTRFIPGFSVVFALSFLCWLLGHFSYIAQTPDKLAATGISWSLGLTGEAGYILSLSAGLLIGNFLPAQARWLKNATRPEWYIKTAIVILGAVLKPAGRVLFSEAGQACL